MQVQSFYVGNVFKVPVWYLNFMLQMFFMVKGHHMESMKHNQNTINIRVIMILSYFRLSIYEKWMYFSKF